MVSNKGPQSDLVIILSFIRNLENDLSFLIPLLSFPATSPLQHSSSHVISLAIIPHVFIASKMDSVCYRLFTSPIHCLLGHLYPHSQ